jgi:hypothetical protein
MAQSYQVRTGDNHRPWSANPGHRPWSANPHHRPWSANPRHRPWSTNPVLSDVELPDPFWT